MDLLRELLLPSKVKYTLEFICFETKINKDCQLKRDVNLMLGKAFFIRSTQQNSMLTAFPNIFTTELQSSVRKHTQNQCCKVSWKLTWVSSKPEDECSELSGLSVSWFLPNPFLQALFAAVCCIKLQLVRYASIS